MSYARALVLTCVLTGWVGAMPVAGQDTPADVAKRDRMVREQIASTRHGHTITDTRVLEAMRRVPRHLFVPEPYQSLAYADRPLPIEAGQTISQPYIVALMTELAAVAPDARVLEVGTGSGYQAAVLAEVAGEVYSIEILEELAESARHRLDALGYQVHVRAGDGYAGWPEAAPFDAILVTAAAPRVPQPLIEQLADGGRLVIPLGETFQELVVFEKIGDELRETRVIPVRFVPMVGQVHTAPE